MDAIRIHKNQVYEALTLLDDAEIWGMVEVLRLVRNMGGMVYLMGNGGSASLAEHFTNDLVKMARIKARCLVCETAVVTAYGNDNGWENMFLEPLAKLYDPAKDCVLGISCSGNSVNVVKALRWASKSLTIGLTGISNSSGINEADCSALVHVRAPDIRVQEDTHLMVCHAVVRALQEAE